MSQTYATRARAAAAPQKAERRSSPELSSPAPSMVSLAANAQPDPQTDLAGAIQARMASAFGTDLSPLRQETGQTVAPRQGAMSAGEPTWSGPVTAPLSAASAAPAAGPMQAKKPETAVEKYDYYNMKRRNEEEKSSNTNIKWLSRMHDRRAEKYGAQEQYWEEQSDNAPPPEASSPWDAVNEMEAAGVTTGLKHSLAVRKAARKDATERLPHHDYLNLRYDIGDRTSRFYQDLGLKYYNSRRMASAKKLMRLQSLEDHGIATPFADFRRHYRVNRMQHYHDKFTNRAFRKGYIGDPNGSPDEGDYCDDY